MKELCQACGKNMTNEYNVSLVGVSITLVADIPEQEGFVKKQLEKYEPGRTYLFCYECWLDSLFGGKK